MNDIKLHKVETGYKYSDDSGWEKRILIDRQEGKVEIELEGYTMVFHPREIDWLINGLIKVRESVGLDPVRLYQLDLHNGGHR